LGKPHRPLGLLDHFFPIGPPGLLSANCFYVYNFSFIAEVADMNIDARRLWAILMQLEAMADDVRPLHDEELNTALEHARKELIKAANIQGKQYGMYLQLPHDYKPPWLKLSDK
jgi:hypothetical protein